MARSPSNNHARWGSCWSPGWAATPETSSSAMITTVPPATRSAGRNRTSSMSDEARYAEVPYDAIPEQQLGALEAILMVTDEPVPTQRLAAAVGLPAGQAHELLAALAAEYAGAGGQRRRGFELLEVDGGWRGYCRPACAGAVGHFGIVEPCAR